MWLIYRSLPLASLLLVAGCEPSERGICSIPESSPLAENHTPFVKNEAADGNLVWLPAAPPLRILEPQLELEAVATGTSVSAFRLPLGLASGGYQAEDRDGELFGLRVVSSEPNLRPLTTQELELVPRPRSIVDYCGDRPMFMWEQANGGFDPSLALVDLWDEGQDPLDDSQPPFISSAPLESFEVAGGLILIGADGRSALTIRLRSIQDARVGEPTTSAE